MERFYYVNVVVAEFGARPGSSLEGREQSDPGYQGVGGMGACLWERWVGYHGGLGDNKSAGAVGQCDKEVEGDECERGEE